MGIESTVRKSLLLVFYGLLQLRGPRDNFIDIDDAAKAVTGCNMAFVSSDFDFAMRRGADHRARRVSLARGQLRVSRAPLCLGGHRIFGRRMHRKLGLDVVGTDARGRPISAMASAPSQPTAFNFSPGAGGSHWSMSRLKPDKQLLIKSQAVYRPSLVENSRVTMSSDRAVICLVSGGLRQYRPSPRNPPDLFDPTPAATRKLASDKARCLLASDINVSRASSVMIIFFLGAACFLVFDAIDRSSPASGETALQPFPRRRVYPNIDDLAIVKSLSREAAACGREDRHRTGAITRSG